MTAKNPVRIAAFISIPRNASNTIRDVLELGPNRDQENTDSLVIYENHQRARVLNRKYDLSNLFVFCFSRNPYDRCVAWYAYHRELEPYNALGFDEWIGRGMPHHWKVQNQTDYLSEGISPLSQYEFVEQYKVDFIGKLENFPNDLMSIIDRLNLLCKEKGINHTFNYTDIRKNISNRETDFEGYYNQKTKETVYSLLEKDFLFFGYKR